MYIKISIYTVYINILHIYIYFFVIYIYIFNMCIYIICVCMYIYNIYIYNVHIYIHTYPSLSLYIYIDMSRDHQPPPHPSQMVPSSTVAWGFPTTSYMDSVCAALSG
jgi:hypothetical protein